jgi:hypothetical protein
MGGNPDTELEYTIRPYTSGYMNTSKDTTHTVQVSEIDANLSDGGYQIKMAD